MFLVLAGLAHAVGCREIANMVDVNVPAAIVAQTIRQFAPVEPGTAACLAAAGAPAEVVEAARRAEAPGADDIPARYRVAVAHARLGDTAGAVAAFREVIAAVDAHAGERVTKVRAAELDHDRDLAILGIARVLYANQRYAEAAAWDDRIGRRSPLWAEAQLEAAWAVFMRNDLNGARARLKGVRKRAWLPGMPWLELLVVDQLDLAERQSGDPCADRPAEDLVEDGAVDAALARLRAELGPLRGTSQEVDDALDGARALEQERRRAGSSDHGDRCF